MTMREYKRVSAEERKQDILQAAMRIFARRGFEGASTKELAAEAGVSEALLFKYFASKSEIYREISTLLVPRSSSEWLLKMFGRPSAKAFIAAVYFLGRFMVVGSQPGRKDEMIDRLIGQSLLGDGHFAKAFLGTGLDLMIPFFEESLVEASRNGDLSCELSETSFSSLLAHHLFGVMALFWLPVDRLLPFKDREASFEHAFMFVLRGVGLNEECIRRHANLETLKAMFQQKTGTQSAEESSASSGAPI